MKIEVKVPNGKCGNYAVETFEVSKQESDFTRIRAFRNYDEYVPEGTYKRLVRRGTIVMSNTPMEVRSNMGFIRLAHGNILINGLGLGMILGEILKKEEVKKVTVVEIAEEVITLVGPTFKKDKRVKIVHADALEYKPDKSENFDWVYHDIWDHVCEDNLKSMTKLHRKYGKRTNNQDSWMRERILSERNRSKNNRYY